MSHLIIQWRNQSLFRLSRLILFPCPVKSHYRDTQARKSILRSQHPINFSLQPLQRLWTASLQNGSQAVVIEMFCGSARVTAALKQLGAHSSFGVDHHTKNSVSSVRNIDLSCPSGQHLFMQYLASPLVVGIFIAPPCGTCSMARYIQLRDAKGRPIPGPPPLRSKLFPNGLPYLSPRNRYRVTQANKLYEFVGKVLRFAASRNLIIVVENPRSSLFWLTSYWIKKGVPLTFTAHQACQYGSTRPKWSVLAHSHPVFGAINKCCAGESASHQHEPWGVVKSRQGTHFATSEETSYPLPLASAIATAFVKALISKGWTPPDDQWDIHNTTFTLQAARALSGPQPKASKFPPLVREHKHVILIQGPPDQLHKSPVQPTQRLKANWPIPPSLQSAHSHAPIHSQLLRTTPIRSKGEVIGCNPSDNSARAQFHQQAWGVPHEPLDFVGQACLVGHPKSYQQVLPGPLKESIQWNFMQSSDADLPEHRSRWLKHWVNRAKELTEEEAVLKSQLAPHLANIIAPKRVLLWKEMLEAAQYPDLGVVGELIEGTTLTGVVPSCPIFEKSFRPAELDERQLREGSRALNKAIFHATTSSGDAEVDATVYEKTLEEVGMGWARGPIHEEDLPSSYVLSKRFGLKQPNKIRLIDDLSVSLVNGTVQAIDSPKPHTTDVIAAAVNLMLSFESKEHIAGRAFDLKPAYKQMAISPNSLWCSFVSVFNPKTRKREVFQLLAVPFGGARSVYSFSEFPIVYGIWG